MKKIVLLTWMTVSLLACKNEVKSSDETEAISEIEEVAEEKTEKGLIITVNTLLLNDDVLILRYTDQEDLKFKAKDYISIGVSGQEVSQDVIFVLPENIIPTRIGLFFGKKNKAGMALNSVDFTMEGRVFSVKNKRIWNFFSPNKFVDFNRNDNSFEGKEIDGKYTPAFNSRNILIERLQEKVY